MLSQEHIQDLDTDFLNIDSFFANNDDDQDDLWLTPRNGTTVDDDWFGTELDPLVQDLEEAASPHSKQPSPVKVQPTKPVLAGATAAKHEPIKQELCCVDQRDEQVAVDDDGYEEDDERDDDADGCCGHYCAGEVASEAEGFLDDTTWFDFNRSPFMSPSMGLQSQSQPHTCEMAFASASTHQVEHLLLSDETDYTLPELTDDEVCALVGSPSAGSTHDLDAASRAVPSLAPPPRKLLAATNANTPSVSEKDIPDMVDLFSSMHSPSEAVRLSSASRSSTGTGTGVHPTTAASLSIIAPTPHMYATMFPFGTHGAASAVPTTAPAPSSTSSAVDSGSGSNTNSSGVNQFDYFTPPGFTTNGGGHLHASLFLNATGTLSPATKSSGFAPGAPPPPPQTTYAQAHALAIANSAMSAMRKLSVTYGVPIAPLQRTLHPELNPKPVTVTAATTTAPRTTSSSSSAASSSKSLLHAATTAASKTLLAAASASGSASASKGVTKISITPDISDFKLVQIFHSFCDPASKLLTLARFHQLVQYHQGKDDAAAAAAVAASKSSSSAGGNTTVAALKVAAATTISPETQNLFKVLDPRGAGVIDLERFMSSFQICNRCTEAKRRVHAAQLASQGQTCVAASALERQLMEDVAPVLVRVVPSSYEGSKVKSCEHYQWTWCEGFAKTGNEKCRGTNRHDKCPKYLANCTLWKHKLPPKNRKAKQVLELQESPSKKFKHFA